MGITRPRSRANVRVLATLPALLAVTACQQGAPDPGQPTGVDATASSTPVAPATDAATLPGNTQDTAPYARIAADEVLRFTGTEPFWGGQVDGTSLTYSTPEQPDGVAIAVERFAGRGGISFTGTLDGAPFAMTVTALECSDGMSDRTYPFTATVEIGPETRNGCAWSEAHPFRGDPAP
jgi:uncharacterized membrane protein